MERSIHRLAIRSENHRAFPQSDPHPTSPFQGEESLDCDADLSEWSGLFLPLRGGG